MSMDQSQKIETIYIIDNFWNTSNSFVILGLIISKENKFLMLGLVGSSDLLWMPMNAKVVLIIWSVNQEGHYFGN